MNLVAATIMANRKMGNDTDNPVFIQSLRATTEIDLVERMYINFQTDWMPAIWRMYTSEWPQKLQDKIDYDHWNVNSSHLPIPKIDQDTARLAPICIARNMAIQYAVAQNATHLLFVDSDVIIDAEGLQKLIDLDKPLTGGLVPGRGAHASAQYVFGVKSRNQLNADEAIIECDHGTCGYMLIKREIFEFIRFRWGQHPTENVGGLSEDPAFCADAEHLLGKGKMFIHTGAKARHLDDPEHPLTFDEAVNDYHNP